LVAYAGLRMRYRAIDPQMFITNRANLARLLLPNSLAVLNANDIPPTNADGTLPLRQNSDLFYLCGVDQEESVLLIYPEAHDETMREILFLRETNDLVAVWEGHKLTKDEARKVTGIQRVEWLSEFPALFHRLMCECSHAYFNTNEHKRASIEVPSRDARFVRRIQTAYPLHDYRRLAPLMHRLRAVKSEFEIDLLREACAITRDGFVRACRMVKPGVNEMEIEAEFAHEFIRRGATFAYTPIVASGANSCVLHYIQNDQPCRNGSVLLLDVGASYANYNADLTRTIPVSGRFTRRQKQVYNAVLRVMRAAANAARPGKLQRDWQKESEAYMQEELLKLGLLKSSEVRRQDPLRPALKKYFMHGIGHPLGLDVHDVGITTEPFQAGWVLTVEPGIYIREEGLGLRLENNILLGETSNSDLMADVPVEPDEIEDLMRGAGRKSLSPKKRADGNH
jgi:Xaa-Pro aminopeptidase